MHVARERWQGRGPSLSEGGGASIGLRFAQARAAAIAYLRWLPALLLSLVLLLTPSQLGTAQRIQAAASPMAFQLVPWEAAHLAERSDLILGGLFGPPAVSGDPVADAALIRQFAGASGPTRDGLRSYAERALARAATRVYVQTGVPSTGPIPALRDRLFPPLLVALTPPPMVLIVSPRTELRVSQSVMLTPGLSVASQEQLEASAESLGVSALVAPIGGIATYPAMVLDSGSPRDLLSSVAHEWLHQYLIFYPLGQQYWASQEAREINETTADLVGNEVGALAASDMGLDTPADPPAATAPPRSRFDFRGFMRATRLEVEQLLGAGDVDGAEAYMDQQRDELERHGYSIRKLNQAYFAFYGSYSEGFAGSARSPIPGLLRQLRGQSPTLADFLERVRDVTTVAQLQQAVGVPAT